MVLVVVVVIVVETTAIFMRDLSVHVLICGRVTDRECSSVVEHLLSLACTRPEINPQNYTNTKQLRH